MRIATQLTALAALAVLATNAFIYAQEKTEKCECPFSKASKVSADKSCSECPLSKTSTVATKTDDEEGCPVSAAMTKLPSLVYKVGDKEVCCSKSAAALAKKAEQPVSFIVGDDTFENEEKAYVALVKSTEKFVENFATPHKCEASGTTTIAGKKCGCSVKAGETAKLVKAAMKKVSLSYKVGEESCHCPTQAAALAKKSGEEKMFVVSGKSTSCEMTARLNLARAKYKAAVEALVAAEPKKDKDS